MKMPIPSLKPKMSTWLDQTNNHFHGQHRNISKIVPISYQFPSNQTKSSQVTDLTFETISYLLRIANPDPDTKYSQTNQCHCKKVYLKFRNIMHAPALLNPTTGTKER
jgi:hypothetical protein